MPRRRMRAIPFLFVCLILFPALSGSAGPAEEALQRELARLNKLAAAQPSDNQLWQQLSARVAAKLQEAGADLHAGRTLLALRGLGEARAYLVASDYALSKPKVIQGGMEEFDKEWKRVVEKEMSPLKEAYQAKGWAGTPAAVRALGEAAWSEAGAYAEASRLYGNATNALNGLFYLGLARASLEFARFCQELEFEPPSAELEGKSVATDLTELEERVEEAYLPPLSIDRHPDFIRINASLKKANEMDEAGLNNGALYAYLEGVRLFEGLKAGAATAKSVEEVEESAKRWAKKFDESQRDESLGRLYLELVALELEKARKQEAGAAARAAVVLEQVLPAYEAALERPAVTPAPGQPVIQVTLVRWPYT